MRASFPGHRLLRPRGAALWARRSLARKALVLLLACAVALLVTSVAALKFSFGEWLLVAAVALPLSLGAGGVCGLLLEHRHEALLLDSQGREARLRHHNAALNMQLARRKLAHRQLAAARDEAEAANRAQSEFLATMNHEIRTPIDGIIGMTELLLDTPLTAEQREYISTGKLSATSLLAVIDNVLDFSKIEAGCLELSAVEFDLGGLVGETLKSLACSAQAKGLELAFEVRPSVPEVLVGDPHRLRQVLLNLVSNAIQFTDHGEVVVTVDTAPERGANMIHLSVRDTGIGIPADRHQLIFQAFSPLDPSLPRRYRGTGLGLAVSARIIRLMQGEMWVDSESGRGSEFHFLVPLPAGSIAQTAEPVWLAGIHTLVVDDSLTARRTLETTLAQWGMTVDIVESGECALAAMDQAAGSGRPYQLVLIDMGMLGMDGLKLAAAIQRDPRLAPARLILLSTATYTREVGRRSALDNAGFLMKPVLRADLLSLLTRLYAGAAQQAEAPPNGMDVAAALQHADGDSARLGQCGAIFLREGPRLMEDLVRALQQGNPAAVRRHAHQLKRSAAAVGGTYLHARATSLENGAAAGSVPEWQPAATALKRELQELRKAVKSFLSAAAPVSAAVPLPPAAGPFLVRTGGRGAA